MDFHPSSFQKRCATHVGGVRPGLLVMVILAAALIPIAWVGWKEMISSFLEVSPPVITVTESPRGIGLTPVSLGLVIEDKDTGLDEIVVRSVQGNSRKELRREKLGGAKRTEITIEFPGKDTDLNEGVAYIEVRAFDRSLWSNRGEKNLRIPVDFRRPEVEVLSTQHNARQGGSQLLFLRAIDEDLTLTGVKVGKRTFLAFPARLLDQDISDPNVFVAIYAIPMGESGDIAPDEVRAFAEDRVGNTKSLSFYNKIASRRLKQSKKSIPESFLRTKVASMAEGILPELRVAAAEIGQTVEYSSPSGSPERMLEQFVLVNEQGRRLAENAIRQSLKTHRHDRLWDGSFVRQSGVVRSGYGEDITYFFGNTAIGRSLQLEYILQPGSRGGQVLAANAGIVAFVDQLGVYGKTIGIDHGLGLFSLYGSLESVAVQRGEEVEAGQPIGLMGRSALTVRKELIFQMRVAGVPVDPAEWLSRTWYHSHVVTKTSEVKRALGIPAYTSF